MAEFRERLADWGLEDVQTYIQSGNLVFSAEDKTPSELEATIADGLQRDYGYEVGVLVLPEKQFVRAVQENPFLRDSDMDKRTLHLTWLRGEADEARVPDLKAKARGEEAVSVIGRRIYLYCPDGYGRTRLSNNAIERIFGQAATTRNWKTMERLLGMLKA